MYQHLFRQIIRHDRPWWALPILYGGTIILIVMTRLVYDDADRFDRPGLWLFLILGIVMIGFGGYMRYRLWRIERH